MTLSSNEIEQGSILVQVTAPGHEAYISLSLPRTHGGLCDMTLPLTPPSNGPFVVCVAGGSVLSGMQRDLPRVPPERPWCLTLGSRAGMCLSQLPWLGLFTPPKQKITTVVCWLSCPPKKHVPLQKNRDVRFPQSWQAANVWEEQKSFQSTSLWWVLQSKGAERKNR